MTEREELIHSYSDYHKEAYGFRPRFDYSNLSTEELKKDFAYFGSMVEENIAREEKAEKKAIQAFENQVRETLELGAENRRQALRWITQSSKFYSHQCVEDWVWERGFLFTDFGRNLVEELTSIVTYKKP